MDPASTTPAPPPAPFAAQLQTRLRQRIVSCELSPGTRLSEQEVADQYHLSRQPVREAFIRLAGEGLIEVRPQRGTFVTCIDLEWVLCTRFIRESVEADITRLAAERATPAEIETLFTQIALQEAAPDVPGLARLDEEFHATLAGIASRTMVWAHLQQMKMHLDRARHLLTAITPRDTIIDQHRAVAQAVADRDPDRAEAAIRLHLRRVLHDLPQALQLSPDYFTRMDSLAEALAAET
ncbi:GntR family transcriptional regulator [Paracoccus aminovorans]|uniref:GntR family transcriptional regulator n=1 Tax=Paracoccus aminovorans TaxID=34004 RepID=UPI002B261857|nr:GntR family transcriptional regulator [Paracoccus aminovorans]